ncbi:MAG: ABC transporter permease [Bacteroidia bacterium]
MSVALENIRQGMGSLRAHALRAVITALIIAIGISALVGILTSIDAMGQAITQTFSKMGSQAFTIRNSQSLRRNGQRSDWPEIKISEAMAFEQKMGEQKTVSLSVNVGFNSRVSALKEARDGQAESLVETNPNIRVMGIDEDYLRSTSYEVEEGRSFSQADVDLALPLVLLGSEVAAQLDLDWKEGQVAEVKIDGKSYRVIGILKAKGSSMGMSGGDRQVFLPITRATRDFTQIQENCTITVSVTDLMNLDDAMGEAYLAMRQIRRLGPNDDDNFMLVQSDALAKEALDNLKMVRLLGTVIAIITLLGAAVSLMNIMLVSVTERTREIGLRKSLGATPKQIRNQFLVEALVICQLGGLGGIVLGTAIGNGVGYALGTSFIIPWAWMLLSILVCVIVGLSAGLLPANRAAKLDPIEALRHDG